MRSSSFGIGTIKPRVVTPVRVIHSDMFVEQFLDFSRVFYRLAGTVEDSPLKTVGRFQNLFDIGLRF